MVLRKIDNNLCPENPLVSVLIPVFNGESFVAEALDSVLVQTHRNLEIIVLDDGSSDSSPQIIRDHAARDPRLRLVSPPSNGFANVLNHGLEIAQGELIARLDADDVMEPGRIETQVSVMREDPDLVLCASHVIYIDESGARRGTGQASYHSPDEVVVAAEVNDVIGFHHPSVMFRKEAVVEAGGYRLGMWPVEDVDLWTRMVEAGARMRVIDEPLTRYRIHGGSGSRALDSVRKLDWIKACARARRAGTDEPTWDEFQVPESGVLRAVNRERKTYGKYLYRRAVQYWTLRSYPAAMVMLGCSFVLMPSHLVKKARKVKFR